MNPNSVPLIPRKILFGNPERLRARLSPDGSKIAFLAPFEGVLNIWVALSENPGEAKPITFDKKRGILTFQWAYTNEDIIYIQDKNGDENYHIYVVSLSDLKAMDLTPFDGIQAHIYKLSHKFPENAIIGINRRDPRLHDIYMLNIRTGKLEMLIENTYGFVNLFVDDDFKSFVSLRFLEDGGYELIRLTSSDNWETITRVGLEDSISTGPLLFDETGRNLYMLDSRNRNTSALVSLDIITGETTTLFETEKADVDDVLIHPINKRVQAVSYNYERRHWHILDKNIYDDFERLRRVVDGEIEIVSQTLNNDFWLVAYHRDDGPVEYYLYSRKEKKPVYLFPHRKELKDLPLAKMRPVFIKARDGLTLVSYLTLPVWSDPDNDGKPEEPLPMVLLVHGGPWGRDSWGYNPEHQWLANRGYAVLSVNFRGSTGFGKDFVNAGNREWGGKMHEDLIDAVDWAVREGIADPKRIAIMGGSYGGYATLVGMTFTPEKFACGVSIVGPSNLITWMENIPEYWKPVESIIIQRVGDYRTEEGRRFLLSRSPINYVDRIKRPLLIAHGANDPRVKKSESDRIVNAMKEKGIPVIYALFPDEGHGFARAENRLAFYAVAEIFLSKNLGGRFEPIGDDFQGSSIKLETYEFDIDVQVV